MQCVVDWLTMTARLDWGFESLIDGIFSLIFQLYYSWIACRWPRNIALARKEQEKIAQRTKLAKENVELVGDNQLERGDEENLFVAPKSLLITALL